MGLDNHFYSSNRKLKTEEDGVTIKRSEIPHVPHRIGSLRGEWLIHIFIERDYVEHGGIILFAKIYYDITHLIPELIQEFNTKEFEYTFPLFRQLLWKLAQGKRIIYLGDY